MNVNRYGSPFIRVATIDEGITFDTATRSSSHPDVDPNRLGYCYNLEGDAPCTATPLPSSDHGMGSYGIISAKTDNGRGISETPNATHIAVMYESIWTSEVYAQTLLWVGE